MTERKKTDRRVIRTRNALHRALIELVREKGYTATSVEDITERANLGRATFYLHYKDKEDLLLEGLEPRLSELIEDVGQRPLLVWFRESNGNLVRSIFEIVKENADLFTLITLEQSNKVYDRFRALMADAAQKLIRNNAWVGRKVKGLAVPVDYLIDYFSGAMWASIVWWAGGGFKQTTDEMTDSFQDLFIPGFLQTLRVNDFAELISNTVE